MQLVEEHLEKANSTHGAAHAHIQKVDLSNLSKYRPSIDIHEPYTATLDPQTP